MEFDEQDAIKYMQENADVTTKYDDDQLLNIIDIIWDYYEDHGLLDISFDDSADNDVDPSELIKYVRKMLRKDRGSIIAEIDIYALVRAELEYETTIDIF